MKLAAKKPVKVSTVKQKNPENVRRGKRSRNKGSNYERTIAKKFAKVYGVELVRTPQSGGFMKKSDKAEDFRGDIITVDPNTEMRLHCECKDHKKFSLPSWIKQAEGDCPEGRIPIVIFHQHGTSKDYVCISLDSFLDLVPKKRIFWEKGSDKW